MNNEMTSPLKCPVCNGALTKYEKFYRCEKNHSFDIAKSGYTNVYPNAAAKDVGDNLLLSASRSDFLNKGYYSHLSRELSAIVQDFALGKKSLCFADAGCASGYYTFEIYKAVSNKTNAHFFGFDLSLYSLRRAARAYKEISFFLCNIFSLPLLDESVDVILSCFCPISESEFKRVIKKDGLLLVVSPARDHLFELKSAVYEHPYENEEKTPRIDGFTLSETRRVQRAVTLSENKDVKDLFSMTPYFYNTSERDKRKLDAIDTLTVNASFIINIYKKI